MEKFGLQNITIKDVLISLLILVVTFGYFFDSYVPKGITEVNILGITVGSLGFEDIASTIYFVKMKLIIIVFSIIWFFTCKHWWKSAIIVITTIEMLKLISVFSFKQTYVDEIEYYTSLPITIPIILLIIFISKKINSYETAKNLRSDLDNKINEIFFEINSEDKQRVEKLKDDFIKLKMKVNIVDHEFNYLKELIEIRNNFYKK
ncbi:hypothetical protein WNY78_06860 [Psychroserpens sp. AS72]|uniref:hypothetical protein n=1 Tax=Psychroserpens sp. AS72 TaxID=3135775 RepID=UPI003176859F